MKKLIAVLICACLMTALFAGCGESSSSGSSASSATAAKSEAKTETKSEAATEAKSEAAAATEETKEEAAESTGEVIQLSMSHHDAATSVWGVFFEDWANEVKEASDGQVDITVYAGAQLAAPSDGLQALRTGVCDILWTNMAFFPGQFPATEGLILPMINDNATAEESTNALWDLWEDEEYGQILADEWSEFKVLLVHGSPGFPIGLDEAASTPDDISGRTLRAPAGGLTDLFAACGANPVLTPSGDIYTSMDKGIIEGYTIDFAGIKGFKLDEVTNYVIDLNMINMYMMIVMTKDKWDSLPDSVKAAFEECSGREESLKIAELSQQDSDAMKATFAETDRVITPTEDEYQLWVETSTPVTEAWIDANSGSFDAQGFLDAYKGYLANYTG